MPIGLYTEPWAGLEQEENETDPQQVVMAAYC